MCHVAAVVRTSRSIHRVCRHPRRERSNVDRVYRRREYCIRKRTGRDAQSGLSPSEIVDDVPALVDFQHRFEFCVHDDVDGLLERCSEMHLDAQVALLYQMEARSITRVRGQIETKEGVPITEVVTSQTVPFVLLYLASRGEQVEVTSDESILIEIRLERFGGYLSTIHVNGEEVDVVVLGVKRVLRVRTVVRVVVDAA